jgi:hypothetical protein
MIASHLRIGNLVALEYDLTPQRIMVLSPGCIHLENCSVETVESAVIPVPITELFLKKTGVSNYIQIEQPGWHKLYSRSLESLNNYLHSFKGNEQALQNNNHPESIVPVEFYLGNIALLKVSYVHHLQNVFFNLSRGHELFPFPFYGFTEEKNPE